MSALHDDLSLGALELQIDAWLAALKADNEAVVAVDRGEPDERRWYVRLRGVEKDFITVWLTLGQRTLQYETYVMPAPEEREAELYEHLLRRNHRLVGAAFAIGAEDAVYLVGSLAVSALDQGELDRVVGSLYAYVEQCFRPALQIGFASRLAASSSAE